MNFEVDWTRFEDRCSTTAQNSADARSGRYTHMGCGLELHFGYRMMIWDPGDTGKISWHLEIPRFYFLHKGPFCTEPWENLPGKIH